MPVSCPEEHFLCLDLLQVTWELPAAKSSECGILLEIWRSGGLLQTSAAIPEGSVLTMPAAGGLVHAEVRSCTQDDHGFLVQIRVDPTDGWFPTVYHPPYLLPKDA